MTTEQQRMVQILTASNDEFIHMFDIKIDEVPEPKAIQTAPIPYWNWMRVVGGIGYSIGILFCIWLLWLIMTAFFVK